MEPSKEDVAGLGVSLAWQINRAAYLPLEWRQVGRLVVLDKDDGSSVGPVSELLGDVQASRPTCPTRGK